MKIKLLIAAIFLPLLFLGCDMNDLFDEGDTKKVYDGPDVVGFFPLQQEVDLSAGAGSLEVQLISASQNTSNRDIGFSVSGSSTAQAGVHYNLISSSPVTISSGSYTATIQVELIEGSLEAGQTVLLEFELQGGGGADPSENLKTAEMFIRG